MHAPQTDEPVTARQLNKLIHPYRYLNNTTNFIYLAIEYASLILVIGGTAAFCHNLDRLGLRWYAAVPVVAVAWFLIGALQHRLAGLGHEASHYILFRNRLLNELVSDIFCMFPLFSTTDQYRQIHLGHHEYPNDWERDPELLNLGKTRMMDQFPMTRWQFIRNFGLRLLWPPTMFRYLWDNLYVTAMGRGVHPYMVDETNVPMIANIRLTTILGIAYLAVLLPTMGVLTHFGGPWLLGLAPVAMLLAACGVIAALPAHWFFASRIKPVYSAKVTSVLRLGCATVADTALCWATYLTGTEWGIYFYLLWIMPLVTTFPYLMLLRDMFQHANADDGRLTNSRVAFPNPILRWAMFVYGQDLHLTHHLYPAVPHYWLPELHQTLKQNNLEYAQHVVECDGAFFNRTGRPTLLDCMYLPLHEAGRVGQSGLQAIRDQDSREAADVHSQRADASQSVSRMHADHTTSSAANSTVLS
jgi:fatty acid desaturase